MLAGCGRAEFSSRDRKQRGMRQFLVEAYSHADMSQVSTISIRLRDLPARRSIKRKRVESGIAGFV